MRFLLVSKGDDRGVTLMEILIVAVITGILAAMATTSMVGMMSANSVKNAQQQLQGALRDAQRQAIRRGGDCEVQINTTANPVTLESTSLEDPSNPLTSKKAACLTASGLELPKDVKIVSNLASSPPKIKFNFKGQTTNANTIVFYSDKAKGQRCLVISMFLGMMRAGDYSGDPTSPTSDNCNTSQSNL